MSAHKYHYNSPQPVIIHDAMYDNQYGEPYSVNPSAYVHGAYMTLSQDASRRPDQPSGPALSYDPPQSIRYPHPYPADAPVPYQQNSYATTSPLPPQGSNPNDAWNLSLTSHHQQHPESPLYPASCENIQYETSDTEVSSDERSPYSIPPSLPTPRSMTHSFASDSAPHVNSSSFQKVGSSSSVYTPGSMSPSTNVSGTAHSPLPQTHYRNGSGTSSSPYPSPYPSPQQTRLTPVLSSLSIEGQGLRYPQSPLSPHGSSAAYSSPQSQSRHRRAPSSAHSISHDQSPQLIPSRQQQRLSSSSSNDYNQPLQSPSSRPPTVKQMVPGTPTHPDIPRPAVVASPVPIPNLIKKSRGRQVPSVTAASGSSNPPSAPPSSAISPVPLPSTSSGFQYNSPASSSLAGWDGGEHLQKSSSFGSGSGAAALSGGAHSTGLTSSFALDSNGNNGTGGGGYGTNLGSIQDLTNPNPSNMEADLRSRPFICSVEGCGKAYIRAEHLKRHVRSIHTNDKPYECPHQGCGREFSRYDNLCQHFKGVHGPTSTMRNQPGR